MLDNKSLPYLHLQFGWTPSLIEGQTNRQSRSITMAFWIIAHLIVRAPFLQSHTTNGGKNNDSENICSLKEKIT